MKITNNCFYYDFIKISILLLAYTNISKPIQIQRNNLLKMELRSNNINSEMCNLLKIQNFDPPPPITQKLWSIKKTFCKTNIGVVFTQSFQRNPCR